MTVFHPQGLHDWQGGKLLQVIKEHCVHSSKINKSLASAQLSSTFQTRMLGFSACRDCGEADKVGCFGGAEPIWRGTLLWPTKLA